GRSESRYLDCYSFKTGSKSQQGILNISKRRKPRGPIYGKTCMAKNVKAEIGKQPDRHNPTSLIRFPLTPAFAKSQQGILNIRKRRKQRRTSNSWPLNAGFRG